MMLVGVYYLGCLDSVTLGSLILWKNLLKISVKYLPWLPHVMPSELLNKRGQGPFWRQTHKHIYTDKTHSQKQTQG